MGRTGGQAGNRFPVFPSLSTCPFPLTQDATSHSCLIVYHNAVAAWHPAGAVDGASCEITCIRFNRLGCVGLRPRCTSGQQGRGAREKRPFRTLTHSATTTTRPSLPLARPFESCPGRVVSHEPQPPLPRRAQNTKTHCISQLRNQDHGASVAPAQHSVLVPLCPCALGRATRCPLQRLHASHLVQTASRGCRRSGALSASTAHHPQSGYCSLVYLGSLLPALRYCTERLAALLPTLSITLPSKASHSRLPRQTQTLCRLGRI